MCIICVLCVVCSEEEHDNLMNICRYFIAHDGYTAGKYIIKSAKNYSANLPDDDYRKNRQVSEEDVGLLCIIYKYIHI